MSRAALAISFEPVRPCDFDLLAGWLRAPHLREWWGDPQTELGHIRDMVEGRDTTRPYIFHVDGEPLGYIQVWYIGHHQNEPWIRDHPWLAALPADAVGVDLSVGHENRLSQGIGSAVLRRFVEMLRAEGHKTIIIDPDPTNGRAVKAYEKAGFRPVPDLIGRTGDCVIMRYEDNVG